LLLLHLQQVCVQLPTSADNVTLPAFAAVRRVAARLLLTTGRAAVDRYLLAAANPQQWRSAAGWDRQTNGRPTVA